MPSLEKHVYAGGYAPSACSGDEAFMARDRIRSVATSELLSSCSMQTLVCESRITPLSSS